MATHCSNLAWEIPWSEEPGRLQYMGPQTLRHDSSPRQGQSEGEFFPRMSPSGKAVLFSEREFIIVLGTL